MDYNESKKIAQTALLAGHLLLENGAEIFRVEETMDRICRHYGLDSVTTFVLSNGIFMTSGDEEEKVFAKVEHIPVMNTHLDKIAAVNELSRQIESGYYTVEEAAEELKRIRTMPHKRNRTLIVASGIGSASFCYLFGGNIPDTLAAFITGLLLYVYVLYVSKHLSKIVSNIIGGAFLTLLCGLWHFLGLGDHLNYMIIGSIMPLIPGVAFTNAIRDIADGDYISGSVRMLDSLLIFVCIAIGVGFGTAVLHRL